MTRNAPVIPAAPGRRFWITSAMIESQNWHRRQKPLYSVHEVAKVFFGMSGSWLRGKLAADPKHPDTWFVLDGKAMDFARRDPAARESSGRIFSLAQIEPMARSLRDFGAIDDERLATIISLVIGQGKLYGLLD